MSRYIHFLTCAVLGALALSLSVSAQGPQSSDWASRLIGAVMGPSPLQENLGTLTDEIGGRVPGSEGNRRGVRWATQGLRAAGVDDVRTETFAIPSAWSEGTTRLEFLGATPFTARAVSIAWSPAPAQGGVLAAPVIDVGHGDEVDFAGTGSNAKGALLLVHSKVIATWADLFGEYTVARLVIDRAVKAGAAGILWTSSREQG